jgi:hypothetical protein
MAYEQKDNSGTLFRNDRKEQEKHPDRKGEALIDGVPYWVAGWIKKGKSGDFLSLAFTKKDAKREVADGKRAGNPPPRNDADIPW